MLVHGAIEQAWRRNLGAYADFVDSQSSVKNVFIRGSVVRYVHLPGSAVDTALLEDGEQFYYLQS